MYLQVDPIGRSATLADADDFRAFAVRVDGPATARAAVAEALVELGELSGDHAFLDADAVRRLAGEPGERWLADFDAMIAYATSKGWTDDTGRVRAHLEWA
jgi:Arc/MetJ family transcription regulator